MNSQPTTPAHQSTARQAGTWKLAAGQAITLRPHEPGLLRVAQGSVWATGDGPHPGPLNDQGDLVLQAGDQLPLRRGQRVVIEALDSRLPAHFAWEPVHGREPLTLQAAALAQPAEDLRLAVVLGVGAAGRLVSALAGLGRALLGRERPSLVECAFKAHSSACRAHGAMS